MTRKFGISLAAMGVALVSLTSQPVLADGGWHHRGHHGYRQGSSWVPFALGAVVGGVAIGAMLQPAPVAPPAYYPPPPLVVRPPVILPAPAYGVPMPPPVYYTY